MCPILRVFDLLISRIYIFNNVGHETYGGQGRAERLLRGNLGERLYELRLRW